MFQNVHVTGQGSDHVQMEYTPCRLRLLNAGTQSKLAR